MASTRTHRIAVIPGDGVGIEVVEAGLRVLHAAAERHGFALATDELPWGSEHYRQTGAMMPEGAIDVLRGYDALYLGAVGSPDVPDDVTLWGLLLPIRQVLDQYVNLRPVRLMPGVEGPLRGKGPADVEIMCVRENTEGEYSGVGGQGPSGPSARGRDPDGRVHARGSRADRALCLRARPHPPRQAHERDEVERGQARLRVLGRRRRVGRAPTIRTWSSSGCWWTPRRPTS